jgi:LysR family nitrogen assimilation transcriptional regulator
MEIRQLMHFIAVAGAGSLRKASENIHISHPAISMSIKNLENSLGVKLLVKGTKGVSLTYAGELFLSKAHLILRQIDDLSISLHSTKDSPVGNVSLGMPYGINNAIAAPMFKILRDRYPGINLIVEEGNTTSLERSFENEILDLMITYDINNKMDQKCQAIYVEEFYFIRKFEPNVDLEPEINLQDLIQYPIVSSPGIHSMRRTIERYAFHNGVTFNFARDFQSAHASLKIVVEGLAYTIAPWDLVHDYVKGGLVTAQRIINPSMERTVCLVSRLSNANIQAVDTISASIKSAMLQAHDSDHLRGRFFAN